MLLDIRDITKSYGRVSALAGVSLSMGQGEAVGVLGPNGAGKTTLFRILLGLERPDAGQVLLRGRNLAGPSLQAARARADLRYVPEQPCLYGSLTGRENLDVLSRLYGTPLPPDWTDLAKRFELTGVMDRKARTYSLGTAQKLCLLAALCARPALLVLDEPTNGLDPASREEFLAAIAAGCREHGTAVLFSSHVVSEVEDACSRVCILRAGRILDWWEAGSPAGGAARICFTTSAPDRALELLHGLEYVQGVARDAGRGLLAQRYRQALAADRIAEGRRE